MDQIVALSNTIHSGVDSCVVHINEANESISKRRVGEGCVHIQDALRVSRFLLSYAINSGFRNAPVVVQAMERLKLVINTLDDIANIQLWGEKCFRYQNKKRKLNINDENTFPDFSREIKSMKRTINGN